MNRTATGPAVVARAAQLSAAVTYTGRGMFTVDGRRGRYIVRAPYRQRSAGAWSCNCRWGQHGGRLCSHVRAASIWLDRWQASRAGGAA